jgi:hypothetical protein
MIKAPLPHGSDGALGANFEVIITHEDLTEATANTAQTLTVPIEDKMSFEVVRAILDEKFEDTADAAFNTTALIVGDGGSTSRFLASMELNVNGSEVTMKNGTGTSLVYTTSDTIDFTFASMAAKSLSSLNRGRIRLQCKVIDGRKPIAAP